MAHMDHIDGDHPTDTPCPHHCSPSCHPAQTGPDWVYGCHHPAWHRGVDFCPIVTCQGDLAQCEIPAKRLRAAIGHIKSGMTQRRQSYERLQAKAQQNLDACHAILEARISRDIEGESDAIAP